MRWPAALPVVDEVEQLREALWECVKLSGADVSDGPPRPGTGDWPQLSELAVRTVRELREAYDQACEEVGLTER